MNEDQVKFFFSKNNIYLKRYLQQNLNYFGNFKVISEHKIFYGMKVDKVILDENNKYLSLIECKGDVGTTEYVRGIGQINQYKSQSHNELKDRMAPKFSTVLAFPNNLNTKNNPVEIEKLDYPNDAHLFIINPLNNTYKVINTSEKGFGSKNKYFGQRLLSISPFYFRDNTFAEIFIGLHVFYKRDSNSNKVSRNLDNELAICGTHNPGNARNVGITLSSLGFIDQSNKITIEGFKYLKYDYADFVENLTYEYAYPFINSVFNIINNNIGKIKNKEDQRILINELWGLKSTQQIEFLTESSSNDKTRYIGSWNYILSRSLQCIKFTPRKTDFKVIYNPTIGMPSIAQKIRKNGFPDEVIKFLKIKDNL